MVTLRKLRPATVTSVLGDRPSSPAVRWAKRLGLTALALVLLGTAVWLSRGAGDGARAGGTLPVFVPTLIILAVMALVLAWVPLGSASTRRSHRRPPPAARRRHGHGGHGHGHRHGH